MTSYQLERLLPNGGWEAVNASFTFTDYHYTDTGLPEDTDVNYRIRGVNSYGSSNWRTASGRTSATCGVIFEQNGQQVTGPLVLGSWVTLKAANCGAAPASAQSVSRVREIEWVHDYGGKAYVVATGPEYLTKVQIVPLYMRVVEDGNIVENIEVVLNIFEPGFYSEVMISDIKPSPWETIFCEVQAVLNNVAMPIMDAYPNVAKIEWSVLRLVDFLSRRVWCCPDLKPPATGRYRATRSPWGGTSSAPSAHRCQRRPRGHPHRRDLRGPAVGGTSAGSWLEGGSIRQDGIILTFDRFQP